MSAEHPTVVPAHREIPGFPHYFATADGRILSDKVSKKRPERFRELRPGDNGNGYLLVVLRRDNKSVTCHVHRLVMLTFVGPPPEGMEVCHKDGDRQNNRLDNLEYGSRAYNHSHKRNHGTHIEGSKTWLAKLTEEAVADARAKYQSGVASIRELAESNGVTESAMRCAVLGQTWKHVNI